MCVCIYMCMYMCMCLHVCLSVCVGVSPCVYLSVCMHLCPCVSGHVCVCLCIQVFLLQILDWYESHSKHFCRYLGHHVESSWTHDCVFNTVFSHWYETVSNKVGVAEYLVYMYHKVPVECRYCD